MEACLRCGIRSAAFHVSGAFECLDPDQAAAVSEAAPALFEACQNLTHEAEHDEHDVPEA